MKNLNKVYYDMIKDQIIEPEMITREEFEELKNDPNVVIHFDYHTYMDQEGKQQAHYTHLKINKSDVDQDVLDHYIKLKSYEKIIDMSKRTKIIYIIAIISIFILIIVMLQLSSLHQKVNFLH